MKIKWPKVIAYIWILFIVIGFSIAIYQSINIKLKAETFVINATKLAQENEALLQNMEARVRYQKEFRASLDEFDNKGYKIVIRTGQENHDEGAKRPNEGLAPWMN